MINEKHLRMFISEEFCIPVDSIVMDTLVEDEDIRNRFETLAMISEVRLKAVMDKRLNTPPNRHARRKQLATK